MYLQASLTSACQPNIGRFGVSLIGVLTRRAARFSRAARAARILERPLVEWVLANCAIFFILNDALFLRVGLRRWKTESWNTQHEQADTADGEHHTSLKTHD
jgi:hypothetical protein